MIALRYIGSLIALSFFALPAIAFAASLSFAPVTLPPLHTGDSVTIAVVLDADNSINTVGTSILLPPELTYLSMSKGIVLTQWVDAPAYNAKEKSISFSGIIAGGWSGTGTLLTIKVAALKDGTYTLRFDPNKTEIYKNDGKATPEPVVFGTTRRVGTNLLLGLAAAIIFAVIIVLWLRRKFRVTYV